MNRLLIFVAFFAVSACGVSEAGTEESVAGSTGSELNGVWHHAKLQSVDGTRIQFDFTKDIIDTHNTKPLIITQATELWVNVMDPSIRPNTKVRVVLNSFSPSSPNYPYYYYSFVQDLTYAEPGRATAKLKPLVIREDGYGGSFNYNQKVAVVIDGVWEQNPFGGDFQMVLNLVN